MIERSKQEATTCAPSIPLTIKMKPHSDIAMAAFRGKITRLPPFYKMKTNIYFLRKPLGLIQSDPIGRSAGT